MEGNLETLGSSLLVPCVQELARESLTTVPGRYIRHDQDPPITSYATSIPDVPTIDMEKLLSGDHMELKKLDSASKEWGFFQLINHGVSSALLEKVKLEINEFFNLPMEAKKKFWQDSEDFEGFGQANVLSEEQKLDWGDMFFLTTLPTHSRKPRLFPKLPLPFRDTLDNYAYELKQLAMKILDYMSKALKMKAEEMRDFFEEGRQSMRMNYYPPCPQPEKVNGLTPHSDGAGLTILLQINEMEGLQIKKDGMWVPVKPIPQTFVVNIGDSLEIVTNGAYRSIEHRAVVNSMKERLSIGTFYSPRVDGEMGPAPSLITPQTPALFRRIRVAEYVKDYFARKLNGKSNLDAMRIEN
ncbi:protein SRG1-like [Rhododendron vialii]|uniref:protein SRG1-like n=1 Tax=Rhododendron vialii TaxID=182163 RepID=UPI00265E290D|nr:protein SRG1-like [Rhododendron vialii]XP_058196067.1 protein SRG1-like [Rhododendron vialii]